MEFDIKSANSQAIGGKERWASMLLGAFSIFVSIFVYFGTNHSSGYATYFIIPLLFGILLIAAPSLVLADATLMGPMVLSYTMVIKYIISPLLSCIAGYKSTWGIYPSVESLRAAIILTVYEMLAIYVVFFCCRRFAKKKDFIRSVEKKSLDNKWMHVALIVVGFAVIFASPSSFSDCRFLFDTTDIEENVILTASGTGIYKTLFTFARYSLVILVINHYLVKYRVNKASRFAVYAFLFSMLNCLYIQNLSRIAVLVPILTGLYLCYTFFR